MTRFLEKPFTIFAAAIIVASILVSGSLSNTASAASPYDNVYKTTDKLYLKKNGADQVDFTYLYQLIIDGIDPYDTFEWCVEQNSGCDRATDEQKEFYRNAWSDKSNWVVSQVDNTVITEGSTQYISLVFTTGDDDLGLAWTPDNVQVGSSGQAYCMNIQYSPGFFFEYRVIANKVGAAGYTCSYIVSSSDGQFKNYVANVSNINYPDNYEGDSVKTRPGAEIVRPRFTYDVVDRNVTATHMPRASALPTYPNDPYSIEWFVHKCTDWDDNDNSCDNYDDTKLHYEITPSGGTTTFTVPDYGHYKISAGYLVGGCHRYPSWPATPDYCYYTAPENTDDYEYTTTAMMWNIDGTSFSGDTADDSLICDVSGFCEPPPFNCADVYSNNFVLRLSCSMQQDMNFGIVNPSLFAIKDLMQSMTVPNNPQCSIPLSNVSLFPGYTFPLASYSSVACAKSAELRNALPIVSVFINFTLAMLSIWMVVRIINKLFDHNDHNIIEGV